MLNVAPFGIQQSGLKIVFLGVTDASLFSPADFGLEGAPVKSNDDAEGRPDSFMTFTAKGSGRVELEILDQLRRGGPEFTYRVEVTHGEPSLAVDARLRVGPPLGVPLGAPLEGDDDLAPAQ